MPAKQTKSFFTSLTFRSVLIGLLMLLMLIPLMMVDGIISERDRYYHQVVTDISRGWGQSQSIIGPVLAVPYVVHQTSVETITDNNGKTRTVSHDIFKDKTLIILPEVLNINVKLKEAHRKRGIYDSLVYKADIELDGHFDLSHLPRESGKYSIRWKKAWLAVGISDTKAINSATPLDWDGSRAKFEPGTRMTKIIPSGFHASMANTVSGLQKGGLRPDFKIKLSVNGSKGFKFAPLGETTFAKIVSSWPHPSFQGDVLPKSKIISKTGFNAEWVIPHLARNYPQSWLMGKEKYKLQELSTGVDLFTPVSLYAKVKRAVKYGVLFIGLTFLTFLVFEVTVKARLHIIQYAIIGLSLSLFYLLLISLSEQIPFMMAYIYAASAIVGIITLYTFAVLRSFGKGLFILILLGSLYTALYFILQMEDYALIAGSGVMLFVLVILMIATRNIQHDA